MRIIVIGGAGTIGKAVVAALSDRHEVVVAGRQSGAVQVDIQSPDSVQAMYREIGSFDALVCTAGEAYFGPFDTMSGADLALGIESKLLGQIRLPGPAVASAPQHRRCRPRTPTRSTAPDPTTSSYKRSFMRRRVIRPRGPLATAAG